MNMSGADLAAEDGVADVLGAVVGHARSWACQSVGSRKGEVNVSRWECDSQSFA